jgi:hypothetical protein
MQMPAYGQQQQEASPSSTATAVATNTLHIMQGQVQLDTAAALQHILGVVTAAGLQAI